MKKMFDYFYYSLWYFSFLKTNDLKASSLIFLQLKLSSMYGQSKDSYIFAFKLYLYCLSDNLQIWDDWKTVNIWPFLWLSYLQWKYLIFYSLTILYLRTLASCQAAQLQIINMYKTDCMSVSHSGLIKGVKNAISSFNVSNVCQYWYQNDKSKLWGKCDAISHNKH